MGFPTMRRMLTALSSILVAASLSSTVPRSRADPSRPDPSRIARLEPGVERVESSRGVFDLSSVGIYIGRERARKALKLRYPNSARGPNFYIIHQLVQPVTYISESPKTAASPAPCASSRKEAKPTAPPAPGSAAPTKTAPSSKMANGSSTKRTSNTPSAPSRKTAGPKLHLDAHPLLRP